MRENSTPYVAGVVNQKAKSALATKNKWIRIGLSIMSYIKDIRQMI